MRTPSETNLWKDYFNTEARSGQPVKPVRARDFPKGLFGCLPQLHTVVDVGCNDGNAVAALKEVGIQGYHGIDFAEEPVAIARERYPLHRFDVCDMLEMGGKYPRRFDGFLLNSVLAFIPHSHAEKALRSLALSLKTGAVGMLATTLGSGYVYTPHGVLYNYHRAELLELLRRTGFRHTDGYHVADKAIVFSLQYF